MGQKACNLHDVTFGYYQDLCLHLCPIFRRLSWEVLCSVRRNLYFGGGGIIIGTLVDAIQLPPPLPVSLLLQQHQVLEKDAISRTQLHLILNDTVTNAKPPRMETMTKC
ncbi:hypothetical protein ALC62_02070 [Cyphomyrmex costatus]|uniref:Uncharacterized protein n=1 Tax=Cyphomyrmex costatus TaxID=456900 RepID=A0A151INN4_9HYME|nr:hypothetical protein ALC62_02070 [Cyphomyrmex costatus]